MLHAYGLLYAIENSRNISDEDRSLLNNEKATVVQKILEIANYVTDSHAGQNPAAWVPQFFTDKIVPAYLPELQHRSWIFIPEWKAFTHYRNLGGKSAFFAFFSCTKVDELAPFIAAVKNASRTSKSIRDFPAMPKGTVVVLLRLGQSVNRSGQKFVNELCEEILVRSFKYDKLTVDSSTSDWRGTDYKIFRRNGADGDLENVAIDEPAFIGVLSGAPDPYNATNRVVTTNRMNCMECHSSEFYGAYSLYSLNLSPPPINPPESIEESALQKDIETYLH